ncbi:MAG: universal stress protein [Desulfobulbus sp.]|nr:universal stress protein [Desulfobulbus sp.]
MDRTILVAIDGSVYSSNSLDYLAQLFAADRKLNVHLLHVVSSGGADKDWMYEVDPLRGQASGTDKGSILARKHLKEAEERLIRHGFTEAQIQTHTKTSSTICTAIREEAKRGNYDAVLIGRRGLGAVGNMFFGSTSSDLIEKCHRSPLWIVDGNVSATRFLLAVHSQPSSLMAADHLAFMLKSHPSAEIYLYHSDSVFGKQTPARAEAFHAQWGKAWCDQYLDLDNFLFYAHAQLLADNGFSRHRIKQLPTQMHLDVSSDLLKQAKQHNCGTIVIGRRRRDLSRGQLKGVSDKTVKQAQNVAVWLAG